MSSSQTFRHTLRQVARIEVWVVATMAAACIAFEALLLPAVIVAALFWLLRWLAYGRLSLHTPLDIPAGALLFLLPVTLLVTPLPDVTVPQVYRLLIGMALCYAIANHAWTQAELRTSLIGLVGLGIALGLVALVSVDWAVDKFALIPVAGLKELPRLINEQIHPNVLAGTLVLLAMFGPAWLLFGGRRIGWRGISLLLLAAAFTLGVLVLTKSRGAWLGLVAGLAVLIILQWPRWGSAAVGMVSLAVAFILLTHIDLVKELFFASTVNNSVVSLQGRDIIWARAFLEIKDFPLTGFGMGTFPQATHALYPAFILSAGDAPHAHNLFLQIAIDLGLPGLAAWIGMAIMIVLCSWQTFRVGRGKTSWLAALGAGLLAAMAALLIHGLVDAVTWGTRPSVVVWGLWGLALAGWLEVNQNSPKVLPGK